MPSRLAAAGDHVFVVYEDAAELYAFVVPYFKEGVAKGERCMFLCADSNPAAAVRAFAARGLRIGSEVRRGGVVVMPALKFFGPPPLDAARAIRAILQAQAEAVAAGFAGLRAAGDWGWTRPGDSDEFRELESLLERAVGPGRPRVACLYRRDRADPDALERLIRLNRRVVASDHVFVGLSALFRELPDGDLRQLARSARARALRKGEFYFHQGVPAKDVFLLTSGLVKLVRTAPGGEEVILRVVAPVQHFGDGRIGIGEAVRFASAEALEESRALAWDSTVIAQVVMAHPEAGVRVIRWLQELMEEERSRLEDFISSDVRRRLARLILRLGESIGRKTPRGLVIDVPLSRRDLAELVITSPYTVSRILAEWRRLDILDAQRTRILIHDRGSLAAIAEQGVAAARADARIS
ncbi:MAG TPA: MEDS domain-containing protein [bacterium]|nr:MEDS domain-containing protein [bacterium]